MIDVTKLAAMESGFFHDLVHMMTSKNSEVAIKGVELIRELLKYGQFVTSLVVHWSDMF
jgi:HD superfamily phosphodiesterase